MTMVAKRANFISKEGGGNYDADLINHFAKIFEKPYQKPRVIFLHFIGSHTITCNRLFTKDYLNYPDKATFNINCYGQTYNDLKSVYEILLKNLNKNGENFQ